MSDEGVALAYDDVTFRYPGSHGDVLSGVSMAASRWRGGPRPLRFTHSSRPLALG